MRSGFPETKLLYHHWMSDSERQATDRAITALFSKDMLRFKTALEAALENQRLPQDPSWADSRGRHMFLEKAWRLLTESNPYLDAKVITFQALRALEWGLKDYWSGLPEAERGTDKTWRLTEGQMERIARRCFEPAEMTGMDNGDNGDDGSSSVTPRSARVTPEVLNALLYLDGRSKAVLNEDTKKLQQLTATDALVIFLTVDGILLALEA